MSSIGSGMTAFSLVVYAFERTQMATSVALITLLSFLPSILLRPIGGVLADRFDRRAMMIIGDLGSASAIVSNRGVALLILIISIVTFYLGFLQTLLGPMVLSFTDAQTLGTIQSVSAVGRVIGTGPGRGIGLMFIIAGILVIVTALITSGVRSIHALAKNVTMVNADDK
ncbi:MAG: Macrolide-efflux protein [Candidatus Carbobacillus altaicus]|uniref:Macrolide-efflux protein n=1 Tax=Candidatus Carbonibacillus altaicus TaxID=2163959 RepID=A0A2R6XZ26_9BACL|nr:MAG: Macrolide-efflux protein [Candidatus Carbobacillus altaicus]